MSGYLISSKKKKKKIHFKNLKNNLKKMVINK